MAASLMYLRLTSILAVLVAHAVPSSPLAVYNSSVACLEGSSVSSSHSLSCPEDPISLLVVRNVFHGVTPTSSGCSPTAPTDSCCPEPFDPARDCVFVSDAQTQSTRQRCDGNPACSTSSMSSLQADVGDACPDREDGQGGTLSYGDYSSFTYTEFSCVQLGLLSNVCDNNVTMSGEEVYLDSNFFNDNSDHADTTCSCVAQTHCQQTLNFELLVVDLSSSSGSASCRETVTLTDKSSGSVLTSFDCSTSPTAMTGGGGGERFQSSGSVVGLDLTLTGTHSGKLLLRITASDDSPVHVTCGQRGSQQLLTNTQCRDPALDQDVISPAFNSSEKCVAGLLSTFSALYMSCDSSAGLISVEKVFHGVTPASLGCNPVGSKAECCPGYNASRDCLFSTEEGLGALRTKCDGSESCSTSVLDSVIVPSGSCPARDVGTDTFHYNHTSTSTFAFAKFSCINVGRMTDVCSAGVVQRGREVYVESNVYNHNDHLDPATCSCQITTQCGHLLLLTPLVFQLPTATVNGSQQCLERVTVQDASNASVSMTLDCDYEVEEVSGENRAALFVSQSNVVSFSLEFDVRNSGKLNFKITATDDATVEVRCGLTAALPVSEHHQCPSNTKPTTTTTTPTTPVPGSSSGGPNSDERDSSSRDTAITIAAVVVAVIVVVVFIIIIVLICRGRKHRSEQTVVYIADPEETGEDPSHPRPESGIYNTIGPVSDNPYWYDNPGNSVKHTYQGFPSGSSPEVYQRRLHNTDDDEEEGAVGGIDIDVQSQSVKSDYEEPVTRQNF